MDDIKATFARFDKDGNGFINLQEAHHILHEELGFDESKTKKLIQVYDRNGDGHLSYEEFIWFYWKIQEKKDELRAIFERFDADKSESISHEEATRVLKDFHFTDEEIQVMIDLHDHNHDGQLQYEEFVHFWNACGGKRPSIKP